MRNWRNGLGGVFWWRYAFVNDLDFSFSLFLFFSLTVHSLTNPRLSPSSSRFYHWRVKPRVLFIVTDQHFCPRVAILPVQCSWKSNGHVKFSTNPSANSPTTQCYIALSYINKPIVGETSQEYFRSHKAWKFPQHYFFVSLFFILSHFMHRWTERSLTKFDIKFSKSF